MRNLEVSRVFNEIADILEIKDENPFRIRAYRKAAQNVENLTENVEEITKQDKLTEIPGIGNDLAKKIKEIIETGRLKYLDDLKKGIPEGVVKILTIPGVGPKTTKLVYDKLAIASIDELEKAAREHRLAGLPGVKEKTEENILRGIELLKRRSSRVPLGIAYSISQDIVSSLKKIKEVDRIIPAGSLRRMKETIGDIDILVTSSNPEKIMDVFTSLPVVKEVLAHGKTKSAIIHKGGIQVDVRVVEPESFGAALAYFTGSKAHNIRLREIAIKKGLKLNEYGIFKEPSDKRIAGKEEEEIYKILNLPFIIPELREDTGEIEAALEGNLPHLIDIKDIRGDFHSHSTHSDGSYSIEEMALEAIKKGYGYIAITDHSKGLGVAHGQSEEDVLKEIGEIKELNKKFSNFRILAGAEVDIRSDGKLDFTDDVLSRLDIVIASIHSGFKQSMEAITKRVISAMKSKYVHIIGHPTGRLLGEREPYEIDIEEVIRIAAQTKTALEINAYPQRLDLNDINCRRAKESGVMLAIGTDAHNLVQLDYMPMGISVAKRGWLEKSNVLNTYPVNDVLNFCGKK